MIKGFLKRLILAFTLIAFVAASVPASYAQSVVLPAPGSMVSLSAPFAPPVFKGIKVYPADPLRFDFILDKGNFPDSSDQLKEESARLIRYFMASLTIPEKDLWVNLSPYEKDRIVPDAFGRTEMGRDLLAQDYLLKQITASVIYPEGETGKKFWAAVYKKAQEKYGTTDIPVDTFNKVWIIPGKAVVYENAKAGTAYVVESRLKVMLESDYVALNNSVTTGAGSEASGAVKESQELAKNVIRAIVLPELEKEVNEGKNFAKLRQVYQSLILAAWFKKKIKQSVLSLVYVDRNKVEGVNINDPLESEKIWAQYVEAFKKGAYDLIKEEQDTVSGELIPRKYFSGGVNYSQLTDLSMTVIADGSMIDDRNSRGALSVVQSRFDRAEATNDLVNPGAEAPHFRVDVQRPLIAETDQKRTEIYGDMLSVSMEMFEKVKPSLLLQFLKNISKHPNLHLDDLDEKVSVSFAGEGAFKYVYKMQFTLKEGGSFYILLAVKRAKNQKDIGSHETNNLRQLNGRGVPQWGGLFVSEGGRVVYVEEFIEGRTIEEYAQEKKLTITLKKKVTSTLLTIAAALHGILPKDMHGRNFIVRGPSEEVIMVDIGNKRLSVNGEPDSARHELLFLAILLAQYGARDLPEGAISEDDFCFFDALLEHPYFKDGKGIKILQDVERYIRSEDLTVIEEYFFKVGRQLLLPVREGVRPAALAPLTKRLINTLNAYLEKSSIPKVPEGKVDATKGGIDLTAERLSVETRGSGDGLQFNIDQVKLQELQDTLGFSPVIINIEPMSDLRLFLGLNEQK